MVVYNRLMKMKTIGIPSKLFPLKGTTHVIVYALDCHTIGISKDYLEEWVNVALFKEHTEALSFEEVEELIENVLWEIRNPIGEEEEVNK